MPTFVGHAPDAADIPEPNPPGPLPPPIPPPLGGGTTYYMATTGSDSDPGGILDPFLTLTHFLSVATPGDNLYVRGGTFTGSGVKNITWTVAGTSGAPITIASYADEVPIFNGQANGTTDNNIFFINANGPYSFVTLSGLKLTNYSMTQDGIITLSNQFSGYIGSWTITNCDIQEVAHNTPNPDSSSQIVYLGEGFYDLLSQNNIYRGAYPGSSVIRGAAITAYADAGAAPTGVVSRGDQYIGVYTGFQLYTVGITGEISDAVFSGPCQTNIDLTYHGAVLVTNNTGTHGAGADIYDPTYSSLTTSSGNVFT